MSAPSFDVPAFKAACESKDAAARTGFFAEDAEWVDCRALDPPSRVEGRAAIGAFLPRIAESPLSLSIEAEILHARRAAFRAWIALPGGRRIVEHVMRKIEAGRIARRVDVEAWD